MTDAKVTDSGLGVERSCSTASFSLANEEGLFVAESNTFLKTLPIFKGLVGERLGNVVTFRGGRKNRFC